MSESIGRGTALLTALLLATACASLGPKLQPPQVTLETLRILRIADGKAYLSLGLRLVNPNDFDLTIDAVELEITLDGRPAAESRSVHVDRLPAGGEARIDMAGRVEVTAVATALMTLGSQLPVDYVVKGTATLPGGALVPFGRKGQIPVARFDRGFGPRPP
jgi:LEA14-like dessication related protein